jgi:hypothetical protein
MELRTRGREGEKEIDKEREGERDCTAVCFIGMKVSISVNESRLQHF